jgi:hypothetical protein
MPWEIVAGSGSCPSDKPFAVIKSGDGELAGCHDTKESATQQLQALYASETDSAIHDPISTENNIKCTGDDCPELQDTVPGEPINTLVGPPEDIAPPPPSDDDNQDENDNEDDQGEDDDEEDKNKNKPPKNKFSIDQISNAWSSVITVEGMESGDGRMFSDGALLWGEDPLPLMYQPSMLPGHDGSVLVGQIQEIRRDGANIRARGIFDLGGPESSLAHEAYRQVQAGVLRGISVDVDSVTDADIEYVYASDDYEDEAFFNTPTLMIVHKGRIRGATLTPMPAFVEAKIALGDELFIPNEMSAAVPVHSTEFDVESPWNSDEQHIKVPMNIALSTATEAFAYVNESNATNWTIKRQYCDFLHHTIDAHGKVGPANITACIAGIHDLNENPTYSQLSEEVRRGVYAHLRAHILEAQMEPTALKIQNPLTAAAHVITIHDVPPASWFNEPKDVQMHGALTVTDEGRVYGLLGPRYVNHRSFPNQNVQVPNGNVDYSQFMGGETIVEGGGRVVTGVITMGCGHADTHASISSNDALEHYDNSCSVVANIRIGEGAHGTWVAGAVTPGVTPEQIVKMMSCRLSGDWRPHSQRSGMYEFCGALLVPVPGFPMARKQSSVTIREDALVAASIPVELIRAKDARTPVKTPNTGIRMAAQVIAKTVGRDVSTRKELIRRTVHGG